MILSCQNICKSFIEKQVLRNVSFHIEDYDKAAIVGINGAGKSTLLKIIMNEIPSDEGHTVVTRGKTIGYLAQHQEMTSGNTIFDELLTIKQDVLDLETRIRQIELSMKHKEGDELQELMDSYTRLSHEFEQKNGYAWKSEITGVLKGLGFDQEDFGKKVDTLSGGQKTRVSLGKLLLSGPDIIMLDEPTNHLDMNSITWLETFLMNYQGAVIIVSHDRYFLNRVVTKIIEIDQGNVTSFSGNYTDYARKKTMLREARMQAYLNQQKEIRHQEEVIAKLKSFNREKSVKRAESREKMLDKIERLDQPKEERTDMKIRLEPGIVSGNGVLSAEGLSKSFGSNRLFSDISFEIKRKERVALIGDNGTGKTTLLKMINEMIPFDAGKITLGTNVKIGYYDQEHHVLRDENTLFEEISDASPHLTNTQVRNLLASFLFTEDDVFKRIGDLSGGEKGRVSLAKLMLSEANFLILDEPTNHLDIVSKEILEDALNQYTGTVLFVSHDRYFINKTATRILDLTEKTIVNYIGNFDYYMEKRQVQMQSVPDASNTDRKEIKNDAVKTEWKQKKEEQAKARKKAAQLARTEHEIAEKEETLNALQKELNDPENATNSAKLSKIHEQILSVSDALEKLYEMWENLAED